MYPGRREEVPSTPPVHIYHSGTQGYSMDSLFDTLYPPWVHPAAGHLRAEHRPPLAGRPGTEPWAQTANMPWATGPEK